MGLTGPFGPCLISDSPAHRSPCQARPTIRQPHRLISSSSSSGPQTEGSRKAKGKADQSRSEATPRGERGEDGAEEEGAAVVGAVADGGGGGGRGRGEDEPRGEGQRHQQPWRDGHHERAPEQAPGTRPHRRRLRGGRDRPRAALLLPAQQQGTLYAPPTIAFLVLSDFPWFPLLLLGVLLMRARAGVVVLYGLLSSLGPLAVVVGLLPGPWNNCQVQNPYKLCRKCTSVLCSWISDDIGSKNESKNAPRHWEQHCQFVNCSCWRTGLCWFYCHDGANWP